MVRIRTFNEIILSLIQFYRTAQPQLDTKPGTVSRDLLIDGPSTQVSRLYEEISRVQSSQSLRVSLGEELDRQASNFGVSRQQGSKASGPALLTFSEIEADIPINKGDIITANNGSSFEVINGQTVSVTDLNTYRATAQRFRSDLDNAGITDEFAVQVTVDATVTGTIGNISSFTLNNTTISGVSNVLNPSAFSGGSNAESDSQFRNRTLSIFGGSNTGTTTGYLDTVNSDPEVIDSLVVGPGNDLMTRDGTVVNVAEDGTRTIVSEGTGGKVDIYVFGIRLVEILDSYIFRDQSNTGNVTSTSNDFVLGQIEGDEDKTVTARRISDLQNGILPQQPVNNIIQVSGSLSGNNFIEQTIDSLGRVSGNYVLVKDTGVYGGSPWGRDRLRWIDTNIRAFVEDETKGRFNGQDPLGFSDVSEISAENQNISVVNENSTVSPSDRTSIQLAHKPITAVTRVFNLTTGETYVISSQNPDGTGSTNNTGRIVITGNTLPSVSDILQVDYTWLFNYDANFDFDNREQSDNPRTVTDSVDWGYSNAVRREEQIVTTSGTQSIVTVTHPVSSVISVNTFVEDSGTVSLISNRLSVAVTNAVENVISVIASDGGELFDTSNNDGSFSGLTIFLPTDTTAVFGDTVTVRYNATNVFTQDDISGSFDSNVITLSTQASITAGTIVEANYIASIRQLLPSTLLPNLPALRQVNNFQTSTQTFIGNQPTSNIFASPGVVLKNLRQAPSRLAMTIAGSISAGVLTCSGTVFDGIFEVIVQVGIGGLTQELSSVIKDFLNISSSQSVPSNVSVVRVISCDRVTTNSSLEVLSTDFEYDIKGYKIRDNSFVKSESISDTNLTTTQFTLPSTANNESDPPSVGESLRITFYIGTTGDSENVSFSKSGTLYTQKIFALVDSIAISSGFTSGGSQTATLTINNTNQPAQGSRYASTYDYVSPKINERITIRYNQNQVITDSTLLLENQRPVTSDVLIKAATALFVDAIIFIVVETAFINSSELVSQNVTDAITQALNASALGTIIDQSDLIDVAYNVDGVDRVRIIQFNLEGETGSVLSLTAQSNEYFQANDVTVTVEER